jgi:hypothetical protein
VFACAEERRPTMFTVSAWVVVLLCGCLNPVALLAVARTAYNSEAGLRESQVRMG